MSTGSAASIGGDARHWDILSEPPVSRFLNVIRHELETVVAPDLRSERGRSVVAMMQSVLDHLIVRLDGLEPLRSSLDQASAAALQALQAILEATAPTMPLRDLPAGNALENTIAELMRRLPDLPESSRRAAWEVVRSVTTSERALHDAVERQEQAVTAATAALAPPALVPAELQVYLNARAPAGSAIEVDSITTPLGGYSKDTFIVSLRGAGRPADGIVIRCDVPNGPLEGSVRGEFAVIEAMFEAGVPVAEPLWLEADSAAMGRPFIVVRQVPGEQLLDMKLDVVGKGAVDCVRQLARVLAQIHRVDPKTAGLGDAELSQPASAPILRLLDQFEAQWHRRRMGPSSTIAAGLAWMRNNIPGTLPSPRIVHGDATLRNMLFADGRVTAMLDWETWHLGDPGEDLAYCRSEVERFMPWDEFVAEYSAGGGVRPSPESERYWGMWMYLRGAITSVTMMDRLMLQPPADIRPAFGGPHFTRFCIRKVADYLQTV
ncbi:MAG: hypothetical protein JWQ90_3967 [Hydrocarboniphaga sp.]|uniref:phosphotransferase family protein n=1 Tax=Hydrocarboniphaga sp. TaxID=2033016 RepID=UPI002617B09A|nr:phosphotransferase family protein [Hydrocarboniphaga sp.]MDB5971517.1 hypothetical protein [Hydrocarboniphaga sp.]